VEVRALPAPVYSDDEWARVREVAQVLVLTAAELDQVFREQGAAGFPGGSADARAALRQADTAGKSAAPSAKTPDPARPRGQHQHLRHLADARHTHRRCRQAPAARRTSTRIFARARDDESSFPQQIQPSAACRHTAAGNPRSW